MNKQILIYGLIFMSLISLVSASSTFRIVLSTGNVDINNSILLGTKLNYSDVLNAPSMINYSAYIIDLNSSKLDKTDQRYNETGYCSAINSSSNIESLGFNVTTKLKTYFDTLYLTAIPSTYALKSDIVGLVGNWSSDKSSYNTTTQLNNLYYPLSSNPLGYLTSYIDSTARVDSLNSTKLNVSDQRYNDTAYINGKFGTLTDNNMCIGDGGKVVCETPLPVTTTYLTSNYRNNTADDSQDLALVNSVGNWSGNMSSYYNITQDALSDFNMWGCYRNGTYCDGLTGQSAHTTATAFTTTVLRCFPFITGKGYKIDQLGFIVATANISNGVKLALYSDTGLGYPNALLTNTSNLASASTGLLVQTITAYQLQNNSLYWLCSATNNSGTTMRVNTAPLSDYPQLLGITSGTASNIGYTVAYTYTNALPNPYTSGATYVTAIYPTGFVRARTDI